MKKICKTCNQQLNADKFRTSLGHIRSECRKCESKARATRAYGEPSPDRKQRRKEYDKKYNDKTRRDPAYRASIICQDSRRFDKKRGLINELSTEGVQAFLDIGQCSYCHETDMKLTLDRIDNSRGHTWDNVVLACYRCNLLRRDMPYEAWMRIVPAIRDARDEGLFGDWTGGIQKVIHVAEGFGVEPNQP